MADGSNAIAIVGDEIPVARRIIAGLVAGRIVNFVTVSGEVRPLLVVNPLDVSGPVNGVLFFDAGDDLGLPLLPNKYGHAPEFAVFVRDVPYAEFNCASPLVTPGTWHFPLRQASVAAAVDPSALSTQLDALMAPYLDTVNAKLEAAVRACAEMHYPVLAEIRDGNPDGLNPTGDWAGKSVGGAETEQSENAQEGS